MLDLFYLPLDVFTSMPDKLYFYLPTWPTLFYMYRLTSSPAAWPFLCTAWRYYIHAWSILCAAWHIYHSFFNRLKKSWKYGTIICSTNFFSFIKKCLNPSFLFYSHHFAITDQIVQIQNFKVQHGYSDILGFQSYILTLHFFSFLHFYSL